jgi:hypothetical protein
MSRLGLTFRRSDDSYWSVSQGRTEGVDDPAGAVSKGDQALIVRSRRWQRFSVVFAVAGPRRHCWPVWPPYRRRSSRRLPHLVRPRRVSWVDTIKRARARSTSVAISDRNWLRSDPTFLLQ